MTIVDNFFNKLCSELDSKYFPNISYYRDDVNDAAVHYAVELFNNGCLSYDKLINKLVKACNVNEFEIKSIVNKYINLS